MAHNQAVLNDRNAQAAIVSRIDGLNATLRDSCSPKIQRLIDAIHDRREQFQATSFVRRKPGGRHGLFGRATGEESCESWISESVGKFLELQHCAEELRWSDCDLDQAIAEIFEELPNPEATRL